MINGSFYKLIKCIQPVAVNELASLRYYVYEADTPPKRQPITAQMSTGKNFKAGRDNRLPTTVCIRHLLSISIEYIEKA